MIVFPQSSHYKLLMEKLPWRGLGDKWPGASRKDRWPWINKRKMSKVPSFWEKENHELRIKMKLFDVEV